MNDTDLAKLRAQWSVELPKCAGHPDRVAVAFCAGCGTPICRECVFVLPVEARCRACLSAPGKLLPSRAARLAGLAGDLLRRRWALTFLAGAALFGLLILFMPRLLQPGPPAVPQYLKELRFDAPYLEKVFRLVAIGDIAEAQGKEQYARQRYREAIRACMAYGEKADNAYSVLQVRLAVGRLSARSGATDAAIAIYEQLTSDATGQAVAGVAHYYLGLLYECERGDSARALVHYRAALRHANSEGLMAEPLNLLVDYHAGEKSGSKRAYAIAALTDTLASAAGARADIVAAIARITGKNPDGSSGTTCDRAPQHPAGADEDPLTVIPGR